MARTVAAALTALIWMSGCGAIVRNLSEDATAGALAQVGKEAEKKRLSGGEEEEIKIAKRAASSTAAGIVEELEQREAGKHIEEVLASGFSRALWRAATPSEPGTGGAGEGVSPVDLLGQRLAKSFAAELALQLRPEGSPLVDSLVATTEKVAAASVKGATHELSSLFQGCEGPERQQCIENRLRDMSRAASSGAATGFRQSIGWPVLLLTFVLGAIAGWVAVRLRRPARTETPSRPPRYVEPVRS